MEVRSILNPAGILGGATPTQGSTSAPQIIEGSFANWLEQFANELLLSFPGVWGSGLTAADSTSTSGAGASADLAAMRWTTAMELMLLAAWNPWTEAAASVGTPTPAAGVGGASIDQVVQTAAHTYGVPAALIQAVIQQESGGNPHAQSPAGAQGLMQLMPATAQALGVTDPFDPVQNVMAGTRYLKQLLDEFGGRVDLALAAYNAGPGAVRRYGGIPPYPETQAYVQSVLARLNS
ncbi:MAG: lytic transglycosylase domain-containing protein [Thermoflavifilum sp.]|nr:lytic transglycosylase domain-containing protein [Thermoflavifilum sp.]MCL6512931.1 lytic transglycosylase domain-containing protein [Alicyclobacillus sp.]